LLRSETLTCVRTDGGIIDVPLDANAVGEDGKVGVRGRLVSKQGALLGKAL
jgi:conjugal transfer pilus assembly protein TraB